MIRSIEIPCDPRFDKRLGPWVIRNPTNSPIATMGQRLGAAARTRKAIEAVQQILGAHFSKPPLAVPPTFTTPNLWTVRLTRISNGTLDPLTGGSSMKAIQDAVAIWCGVKNEQNPIWRWIEPIGQEKRGRGVFGVRIEIESLEPGEDRIVRLAFPTPQGRSKGATYQSGAYNVHEPPPARLHASSFKPAADPGEERAAAMLVACDSCGADVGQACRSLKGAGALGAGYRFGVHPRRAEAAGIHGTGAHRAEPANMPKGPRKLAEKLPPPKLEAWAVKPWGSKVDCEACEGSGQASLAEAEEAACKACRGTALWVEPVRWPAMDAEQPADVAVMRVPFAHIEHSTRCRTCGGDAQIGVDRCRQPIVCDACSGTGYTGKITMRGREWSRDGKRCWLYEPA